MRDRIRLTVVIALLALLVVCCKPSGNGGSGQEGQMNRNGQGPERTIKLGKEEAIKKVQLYLDQHHEGRVTVDLPYKSFETVSVPCSQIDVDTDPHKGDAFLARCKPIEGAPGAPYGSKSSEESQTKCCRSRQVEISTIRPRWTAEYSKETDSWAVEMDFDVDSVEKVVSWIVNDDSGTVTEKPDKK